MLFRLDRRTPLALLCVLVPLGAAIAPAVASSTPTVSTPTASTPTAPVVAPGPVTMGSLQVVNALTGDQPMTLWIGGKVRAIGVPAFSATSPIVVPGGAQRVRIARSEADRPSTGGTPPTVSGTLSIDVPAGTRRTLFVVGSPAAPRSVVVDALETGVADRMRIVDLRSGPNRSTLRVNGLARPVDRSGVSETFVVPGLPVVSVDGVTTDARPEISDSSSLLFVADSPRGALAGGLTQGAVGLDSLRSQIVPVTVVRQSQSLFGFFGALALVITATAAALSSMLVFRNRSREERVRSLMASSLSI